MNESFIWNPATLREQRQNNPDIRMIDVRSSIEYESIHIPGSYNIPTNMLSEHKEILRDQVRCPVVFVCYSGVRSKEAYNNMISDPETQKLIAEGLTNIHILEGGITAWETEGGEVKRGAQRWSVERQIRCITGSVVLIAVVLSSIIPWTKWIAAFVGGGLTFAAITRLCMMEKLLLMLPYNRASRANVETVINQLIDDCKISKS